jgi:hypothetical protein
MVTDQLNLVCFYSKFPSFLLRFRLTFSFLDLVKVLTSLRIALRSKKLTVLVVASQEVALPLSHSRIYYDNDSVRFYLPTFPPLLTFANLSTPSHFLFLERKGMVTRLFGLLVGRQRNSFRAQEFRFLCCLEDEFEPR